MKPALDIAVFDTESLQGFQKTLEQAIFILSQSDTARYFGQAVIDHDYVVLVEDKKDMKRGETGATDHDQKIIFLTKNDDAQALAIVLSHEFCHVSQRINGGIFMDLRGDHPHHSLKKFMMQEADARAHEIGIAIELEPAFNGIIQMTVDKSNNPILEKLVEKAGADIAAKRDAVMAGCFKSVFLHMPIRNDYEGNLLQRIASLGADVLSDAQNLSHTETAGTLMVAFNKHGAAYLDKHSAYIADSLPPVTAVTQQSYTSLRQIEQLRDAPFGNIPVLHSIQAPQKNVSKPPQL